MVERLRHQTSSTSYSLYLCYLLTGTDREEIAKPVSIQTDQPKIVLYLKPPLSLPGVRNNNLTFCWAFNYSLCVSVI